jgi:hypothetical protein
MGKHRCDGRIGDCNCVSDVRKRSRYFCWRQPAMSCSHTYPTASAFGDEPDARLPCIALCRDSRSKYANEKESTSHACSPLLHTREVSRVFQPNQDTFCPTPLLAAVAVQSSCRQPRRSVPPPYLSHLDGYSASALRISTYPCCVYAPPAQMHTCGPGELPLLGNWRLDLSRGEESYRLWRSSKAGGDRHQITRGGEWREGLEEWGRTTEMRGVA